MERALRVDPANVESRVMLADFQAQAGRLDEAVASYKGIIASEPGDTRPRHGLADVLKRRGDITGAIDALGKAYELEEDDVGVRAMADARTEEDYDRAQVIVARARLAWLLQQRQTRYVSPLEIARLHAQVGDRDEALDGLQQALIERSPGIVLLKVDRAWDPIRLDARFATLVKQVGIP